MCVCVFDLVWLVHGHSGEKLAENKVGGGRGGIVLIEGGEFV